MRCVSESCRLLVILTSTVLICEGIYLCFGDSSAMKSRYIYRRFLALGIVMISFGLIILIFILILKNSTQEVTGSTVFGCGSVMTFSSSFLPLVFSLITYYLHLEPSLDQELNLANKFNSHHEKLRNQFPSATLRQLRTTCDISCRKDIMRNSSLMQTIAIISLLANGLSLQLLAFIKEYVSFTD